MPSSLLANVPSQLECVASSIDIHRKRIDRKRSILAPQDKSGQNQIVTRLLKAFGSPLCAYEVVVRTISTLVDVLDLQPYLVNQLIEKDICLLLVSWLGQSKRNSTSDIPKKLLRCIARFLSYSERSLEIAQLFVDGFLYENLAVILEAFNDDKYILASIGKILHQLAELHQVYDESFGVEKFLDLISYNLLEKNVGVNILIDYYQGVMDWNRESLRKKTKPVIEKIIKRIFSPNKKVDAKTVRQFLTLVLLTCPAGHVDNTPQSTSSKVLKFRRRNDEKEICSLLDATLQCFLDHSKNSRLSRIACEVLCGILKHYYNLKDDKHCIVLYTLNHPVCDSIASILQSNPSLDLALAVLRTFVLLFPSECLFRDTLLRSGFVRYNQNPKNIASSRGAEIISIILMEKESIDELISRWLPLIESARYKCQSFRRQNFKAFLERKTFSKALNRRGFPSIALILGSMFTEKINSRKSISTIEEVFFSDKITNAIASFL